MFKILKVNKNKKSDISTTLIINLKISDMKNNQLFHKGNKIISYPQVFLLFFYLPFLFYP